MWLKVVVLTTFAPTKVKTGVGDAPNRHFRVISQTFPVWAKSV